MTAYVVVQAEVTDWDRFREYLAASPGTIARHGENISLVEPKKLFWKGTMAAKDW